MTQPESLLQRNIQAALKARGAFVFKVHGNALMMSGLPDIIGCYRGHFIAVEVKMPGKWPTMVQKRVIGRIKSAGGQAICAHSIEEALTVLEGIE